MKIIYFTYTFRSVLWLLALLLHGLIQLPAPAQIAMQQSTAWEDSKPVPVLSAPATGTFYRLGQERPVPYPFDPYFGQLPVFFWDGVFFLDDRPASLLAQSFSFEGEEGGGMMMLMSGPGGPGGFSGTNSATNLFCSSLTNFTLRYRYSTNGLSLGIAQSTNSFLDLTIHTATTSASYDLFGTTNLSDTATNLNRTNWVWLARITGGTTNFSWGLTNWCERYFQLGTLVDDDLDGLTTAYEILVSHTRWAAGDGWDSDGDGLSDDFELRHSHTDPNNPDTGNTGTPDGYKDPDGDGWTHLDEMRNGTNPLTFNTPAAPPNVSVHFVFGGTNATLSWAPANGPVTGYIIRNGSTVLATVSSNTFELVVAELDSYTVQAVYAGGSSELTGGYNVWNPALAIRAVLVRGPANQRALIFSTLPDEVDLLLFTWTGLYGETMHSSISRSNIVNGICLIPRGTVPVDRYSLTHGVNAAGQIGVPIYAGYVDDLQFTDIRQVLSDNLHFLLRGGTVTQPFSYDAYGVNHGYLDGRAAGSGQFEYSGFHRHEYFDPYHYTILDPVHALQENFYWRNFVFNSSLFRTNGVFLTGAYATTWGGSRRVDAPLFTYQGTNTSQLATNQTPSIFYSSALGIRWSCFDEWDNPVTCPVPPPNTHLAEAGMFEQFLTAPTRLNWTLSNAAVNVWGLPIDAVDLANSKAPAPTFFHLTPGQSANAINYGQKIFLNVRQPVFQTAGYYFTHPDPVDSTYSPPIPGEWDFSTTNITPLLITSVGQMISLSGWARKIITNGDTNKPAYLEQFFDKAFKADANGNATTNETGVLSEFGEFFPTEPGRTILKTKPDIETSEVGTALVHVISLNVDANHDGTMDRSFTGPDNTSSAKPFRFWVNNDSDVSGADLASPSPANHLDNRINGERDLEDFPRLWISGVPTLPAGYTAKLSWTGSGAIKLYSMYESEGGIGYLTNSTVANNQSFSTLNGSGVWTGFGTAIATNSASSSYEFPANTFTNGFRRHFLFEGIAAGQGELVLTIRNGAQTVAQTSVHILLQDVKDMYERAYAENVTSGLPPSSLVSRHVVRQNLPAGSSAEKQMIVFVHGINNSEFDYENTSETMFKRLYWAGYRGQFAAFRWPCAYLPNNVVNNPAELLRLFNYNKGEFYAWKSAQAFKDYLTYLDTTPRLAGYSLNILAHSMGNVVASEAVKLGAPFDNYILSQGAVPAHCYDVNAPSLQKLLDAEAIEPTPFHATNGGYHAYFAEVNGNLINFHNTNDFALARGFFDLPLIGPVQANWEENQKGQKPESFGLGPRYSYSSTSNQSLAKYYTPEGNLLSSRVVTDVQETKAMVARSRSRAVGAQSGLGAVIQSSVDLSVLPFGFGDTRPEHSAQFTRNVHSVRPYYQQALRAFNIEPAP